MKKITEETLLLLKKEIKPQYLRQLTDEDITRFYIARKYDIPNTLNMIDTWGIWYNNLTPDNTITIRKMLDAVLDENEEVYTKLCPLSHSGEDITGCPVFYEQSGLISGRFAELCEHLSLDTLLTRHIRNMELAIARMHHLSIKHGRTINQQVIVYNMEHLTYTLDTRAMSVFRKIITIDSTYYPERLKYFILINVPWYFKVYYMYDICDLHSIYIL